MPINYPDVMAFDPAYFQELYENWCDKRDQLQKVEDSKFKAMMGVR